jgi:hypothetical protein
MRDEYFEYFISKFGEATSRVTVPTKDIEKWRGKLPEQLLAYWAEEGWCSYANGLLWTVDPEDYEDLVDEWLTDTLLEQIDSFHAIARSAFGDLYLCGETNGNNVTICCELNAISVIAKSFKPKSNEKKDASIRSFFAASNLSDFDLKDERGSPLFERAVAKLGPLEPDEIYGFEPALVLGGKMRLENLAKLKLDAHLTNLRQLAAPTLPFSSVDVDKLLNP